MDESAEIKRLVGLHEFVIGYEPLRTEVPFEEILRTAPSYRIPARASLDPLQEAGRVVALAEGRGAVILMPGRMFDVTGTRLGQGGGWYDRFLAQVPREWLRIGFCFDDQFSTSPLPRQSWDQAVDYVVVIGRKDGKVVLYSTESHD